MKKNSLFWVLAFFCMAGTWQSFSQIAYSEDFESFDAYDSPWSGYDYWVDDEVSCSGEQALTTNLYYYFWDGLLEAETVTPSIGTSNGGLITLSYDYKLLNYEGLTALDTDDWGTLEISYATSPSGPFTILQTITPENHIVSADCATKTVTFSAASGAEIYLKIRGEIDNYDNNDFMIYIDNITATQAEPVPCDGAPAAADAVASLTTLCNNGTSTLSLSADYYSSGIEYQWQSSTDGVVFADIDNATTSTYIVSQTETTWYQAIVTCSNTSQSITTTPVLITSSGLECLCDVTFEEDVEPITYVNFAGIDNTSSAAINGTPGVQNFTNLDPAQVEKGGTYTIILKGNTNGSFETFFTVFIDFNQDGNFTGEGESFEAGSVYWSSGTDDEEAVTQIEIPDSAMTGITYMRVMKLFNSYSTDPCSSEEGIGYGQVEDYLINISCPDLEAPEFDDTMLICSAGTATGAMLSTSYGSVAWYASATGDDAIEEDDVITSGTYYAASVLGDCISEERTPVAITISAPPVLAEVEDVTVCESYTLPELAVGNYYSDEDGTGSIIEAGYVITGTATIYVYAETAGCSAQTSFVVTVENLEPPVVTVMQPDCASATGTITAAIPPGSGYMFSIDEGATWQESPVFSDLSAGTYTVIIQSAQGCEDSTTVILEEAIVPAVPTYTVTQPNCSNITGSIAVTSPVGAGYMYSINNSDYQVSASFDELTPGDYIINVQNESGCTSQSAAITIEAVSIPEAPTVTVTQPGCAETTGTIEFTAPLGAGFTYSIDAQNYQASPVFSNLAPGTYSVVVMSEDGCYNDAEAVTVNEPTVAEAPVAESPQEFSIGNGEFVSLEDIEVTATGTLTWYASEADAIAGNVLDPEFTFTESMTLYVTQTINGCESEPTAVTLDVTLGTVSFNQAAFNYYPNPVKEVLSLSYNTNITMVEVYNLVGQQVMVKTINASEAQINMAQLAAGTYMVKVTAGEAVKTVKIIKQ